MSQRYLPDFCSGSTRDTNWAPNSSAESIFRKGYFLPNSATHLAKVPGWMSMVSWPSCFAPSTALLSWSCQSAGGLGAGAAEASALGAAALTADLAAALAAGEAGAAEAAGLA